MTRVFFHQSCYTACSLYRSYLPAKHLKIDGVEIACGREVKGSDCYIFHRWIPDIKKLKDQGHRVAIQVDDNLWNIPKSNDAHGKIDIAKMNRDLDACDVIITSTEPLSKVINRPQKTVVAPNLVDCEDWQHPIPSPKKPRIVFAGSPSHSEDVGMIVPALMEIIQNYDIEMIFFGYIPIALVKYEAKDWYGVAQPVPIDPRIKFVPHCEVLDYPRKLCSLGATIGLAPLRDNEFNQCKSNIKWLEYSMAGILTIASWQYQDALRVNYEERTEHWIAAIEEWLYKPVTAQYMANLNRFQVVKDWSWQHSETGINAWKTAIGRLVE